jgi:hypothetical protein
MRPLVLLVAAAIAAATWAAFAAEAQEAELVEVPLNAGTVTFRQADGLLYGVGDVECGGFGVNINLPGGTVMCFSETGIVTLDLRNAADDELVATILADSPGFRLVTLPLPPPSQTPPPGPPRTGSGARDSSGLGGEALALLAAGFVVTAGGWAAVTMAARRRA